MLGKSGLIEQCVCDITVSFVKKEAKSAKIQQQPKHQKGGKKPTKSQTTSNDEQKDSKSLTEASSAVSSVASPVQASPSCIVTSMDLVDFTITHPGQSQQRSAHITTHTLIVTPPQISSQFF